MFKIHSNKVYFFVDIYISTDFHFNVFEYVYQFREKRNWWIKAKKEDTIIV